MLWQILSFEVNTKSIRTVPFLSTPIGSKKMENMLAFLSKGPVLTAVSSSHDNDNKNKSISKSDKVSLMSNSNNPVYSQSTASFIINNNHSFSTIIPNPSILDIKSSNLNEVLSKISSPIHMKSLDSVDGGLKCKEKKNFVRSYNISNKKIGVKRPKSPTRVELKFFNPKKLKQRADAVEPIIELSKEIPTTDSDSDSRSKKIGNFSDSKDHKVPTVLKEPYNLNNKDFFNNITDKNVVESSPVVNLSDKKSASANFQKKDSVPNKNVAVDKILATLAPVSLIKNLSSSITCAPVSTLKQPKIYSYASKMLPLECNKVVNKQQNILSQSQDKSDSTENHKIANNLSVTVEKSSNGRTRKSPDKVKNKMGINESLRIIKKRESNVMTVKSGNVQEKNKIAKKSVLLKKKNLKMVKPLAIEKPKPINGVFNGMKNGRGRPPRGTYNTFDSNNANKLLKTNVNEKESVNTELDFNQKQNLARGVLLELLNVTSRLPMIEFSHALETLETLTDSFNLGKRVYMSIRPGHDLSSDLDDPLKRRERSTKEKTDRNAGASALADSLSECDQLNASD